MFNKGDGCSAGSTSFAITDDLEGRHLVAVFYGDTRRVRLNAAVATGETRQRAITWATRAIRSGRRAGWLTVDDLD